MEPVKRRIVGQVEAIIGRHDQATIYGGPDGDPGLCGPGSVSWKIHGDVGVFAGAGLSAIVMELLHPLVMAGVDQQSDYREHPERRARSTFGYVTATTFGNTGAATRLIANVLRIHRGIRGVAPDGREYYAADPALLTWVHASIPLAMMLSYERYRGPLSVAEKDRYLAEQAVIARMGGADDVPETVADLDDYLSAMRPQLEFTDTLRDFIAWATSGQGPAPLSVVDGLNRRLDMHAAMSLMPRWAQRMTRLEHPGVLQPTIVHPRAALNVRLVSWAFGTPAYRRMAEARAAGVPLAVAA
jgi:uncharacterized protein (DUF2236 family)